MKPSVPDSRALARRIAACLAAGALLLGVKAAQAQLRPDAAQPGVAGLSLGVNPSQESGPIDGAGQPNDHGIAYRFIYTNDVLRNVSGGIKRGTIDQGLLEGRLGLDLGKLAGWQGWTLYANAFQIHDTGRFLRDYVGGINTIAAIEARPTTRLSELWLEKTFRDGAASFRIGQLAADTEFFFSDHSAMFLQSDWPTIAAVNLPSGGPAYPFSTPGMRLKFDPADDTSLLLAVYDGDPAGPGPGSPQVRDPHGLNFRLSDPPLIMGEAQFRHNEGDHAIGLARTVKLGFWVHMGKFNDNRYGEDGSLLANPAGIGIPAQHRGDFGIYGIIDQQIYRPQGGASDRGIYLFSRASMSPSDRNLINAYIDGGIVFAGLIPNRPKDRFGASVIYARYSNSVRAFERDQIAFTGLPEPIQDYQANLELTYVFQFRPGWTIQPDFQYIRHIDGDTGRDARVIGLRNVWRF